ncbi:MAG: magnesium transporter [Bacilli bacterium]|nr:magnesium transporter [Bacilli bacterium]
MEQEIRELLNSKKFREAKTLLSENQIVDIAYSIKDFDVDEITKIIRLMNKDMAADLFSELPLSVETEVLSKLTDKEAVFIINEMFADDAADVLDEMPASLVRRILRQCDKDTRSDINKLLNYPEDSAGSVMTVEYAELKGDLTIHEAISILRKEIDEYETVNVCYVVSKDRKLIGHISLKDILLAHTDDLIIDVATRDTVCVRTSTDQEEVGRLFKKYDLTVMPVVDSEDRLVGIITIDDIMDIMEEEATEDIEKMAAISPSDKPYLDIGVFETWKARIPWLLLLMISATFTGGIISSFENSLAILPVLTAYIPMLMDTGGNAGSQASVTIIRGLSLNQVNFKDIGRVIFKELKVSMLIGLTLAITNFLKLIFIDKMLFGNTAITMQVAIVICVTIFMIVVVAKFIGCTLPILTKKLGFDPTVMASPFITTIVDAVGLIVYFQVATHMLGI